MTKTSNQHMFQSFIPVNGIETPAVALVLAKFWHCCGFFQNEDFGTTLKKNPPKKTKISRDNVARKDAR
ncbi:MAG: hypothetical protein K2Q32_02460 [Alphaproteobacteria bacterium]|nr:hypothetical protein [Alphaproteobacteria bacterium]